MKYYYTELQDLPLSIEDYRKINWKEVLKHTEEDVRDDTRIHYFHVFHKRAENAYAEKRMTEAKIFILLSVTASLLWNKPDSPNEPFTPFSKTSTGRTPSLEDFTTEELIFFEQILSEIDDIYLKSRIADILWILKLPRNPEYALCAINAYRQYPLKENAFYQEDSSNAWRRGLYLSSILTSKGKDDFNIMISQLNLTFKELDISSSSIAVEITKILKRYQAFLSKDEQLYIAQKLESAADIEKLQYLIRYYLEEAIQWYKGADITNRTSNIHSKHAAIIEKRIEKQLLSPHPNFPQNISDMTEEAIQILRQIPKSERKTFNIEQRLQRLRRVKHEADGILVESMTKNRIGPINLTEVMSNSQKHITGKNLSQAIISLVGGMPLIRESDLRSEVKNLIKSYPLNYLFKHNHRDRSGHKISDAPSLNLQDIDSEENEKRIFHEILELYCSQIDILTCAYIIPALNIFNAEHHITEELLFKMVACSPYIPQERRILWVKALYYGFNYEYSISTSLLTPQLEHLIRVILQGNDISTTAMDSEGNETKNSLGTLIQEKEILTRFFGEDMYFALRALLTEKLGFNLRNYVAHGLLSFSAFQSSGPVYLWWFCLRLIVMTSDLNMLEREKDHMNFN